MTTRAPCRASSRTIAWPIPLLPPVTIAVLLFRAITPPFTIDLHCFAPFQVRRRGEAGSPLAAGSGRRPLRNLRDQVCHKTGPAGLVRSAAPASIVAVKALMEQDVVLEMRIGLELFICAENGPSTVGAAAKEAAQVLDQQVVDRHPDGPAPSRRRIRSPTLSARRYPDKATPL